MKTHRSTSLRKAMYAALILVAFFGLLPALLTPPATSRAALAGASSSSSQSGSTTQKWGTSFLSRFIQAYRIRHKTSGLRNVAAARIKTPDHDVVVVAASAGDQVDVRNVIFDVYIDNKFVKSINHDDYIEKKRARDLFTEGGYGEDNWDSEQLIGMFLQTSEFTNLTGVEIDRLDPQADSAEIESELELCRKCDPYIRSLFASLADEGNLDIAHNFDLDPAVITKFLKKAAEKFEQQKQEIVKARKEALQKATTSAEQEKAIKKANSDLKKAEKDYQNAPADARRAAQKAANEDKAKAVKAWTEQGGSITGQSEPGQVSAADQEESTNAQQQMYASLGLPWSCGNTSKSLGKPSGGDGQVMTMAALSSAADCGEGEGTPGGLAQALESANLGGVDFSTLQMRYISDPGSGGLRYSFSGQLAASGVHQDIKSGLSALTNSAADLRTWLVLSPDKFWVNLNPTEPDRIIDPQLGETNAGKALLEADLQLKTTSAKLEDPRTKTGARYWKALAGSAKQVCYGSRMWIIPGNVQVREDGGSLYILNAQLAVKAVPQHVAGGPSSCHYNAATDARGERLDDTMLIPQITKAVNTAPEYAPIRRAFMARIVAQWIRERYERGQRTSLDKLIDTGNIGPARLQDGWQPQQVFDTYVGLIKNGIFTYKTTVHQGGATYIETTTVGGVDFTSLHPTAISAAQMKLRYPQLPQTAKASAKNIAGAPDGSIWLGGTLGSPSDSQGSAGTDAGPSSASGRTGILILILVALGVTAVGFRRRARRRRRI